MDTHVNINTFILMDPDNTKSFQEIKIKIKNSTLAKAK
jgi:hypothetical protein